MSIETRSHPLRAALSAEMHVRRLPRFASPCRLMQVVSLLGEDAARDSRTHIEALGGRHGAVVPPDARYAVMPLGDVTMVWERHTEFASYTFIREGAFDAPFDIATFAEVAADALNDMPGEIVRATQIAVSGKEAPDPDPKMLDAWFEQGSLIVCDVADGKARVMSDFRLHGDGFGRLLIADRGLEGDESAQLVLRLQELGNYRNMALLGLPLAQRLTPDVAGLEKRLATLTHAVSERVSQDDTLLDELTYLSAELARIVAETRYRMSATRAYAQLSMERLTSLTMSPVRGYQTLADFTERRLLPALRTCDSFSQRLDDLSQRAAWTSELLRTRIDIALAKQNRDLLESMNNRTQLQLRLQQTVEGLSVVAISYYLVMLIGYLLGAVPGFRHDVVMAVAVPIVVVGVALALRRFRHHFTE
ncbi:DUF3422 family protein [Sphingomonas koreensis]|nr:DUF3422 family protein [Sphingomonas koreensis]TPG38283.1 DUF3422 family protein [Sphingomonas koreensis]